METHLPFRPPDNFIEKFAPYFKENRAARDFMRRYNVETFRWLAPFEDIPSQLELDVLNDLYDAEVNYQDHLLGQLLEFLSQTEDTLTIIVADHGEGIGEHNFMGHSFVAYQELVQVPLFIKFPEKQGSEQRLSTTVSTRRLFHTILEAARLEVVETNHRPAADVKALSLRQTLSGHDPEEGLVFVEAYPPTTILSIMSKHTPQLLDQFYCRLNRWAVYQNDHKLVKIEGVQDELFNLAADPAETQNIIDQSADTAANLSGKLKAFIPEAIARRPSHWQANQSIDLENDENIIKQLQALGYIE